jgi:ribosomal protein L37AE/L43A
MQTTHHCNGPGLPNYPSNVKPKAVNVWVHDSGMIMTHDYSCPCCRENSAVIDGSTGIMQPCWKCKEQGYKIVKQKQKRNGVLDRFFDFLWN